MGYPEKLLANDERVVEHLHPHWITLVPATFWLIVVGAAAGAGIAFAPDDGTGRTVVLIAVVVVAVILIFWLTFGPWIRWRTTHYVFTTHRVLIRHAVLHHTGRDISLQRISDVAFSQSLWDRMVRSGTLVIESAGEHGQETLKNAAAVRPGAADDEPTDRGGPPTGAPVRPTATSPMALGAVSRDAPTTTASGPSPSTVGSAQPH